MQKEINKLLKRINVEKLKKNHKECIELYNIIGGIYSEIGSYDEAIHYHEQSLDLCKTTGDRLGTAVAYRYIGEAKAALGDFEKAIEFIKKYLELAEKICNPVEKQRAWTTLGRIYLMQAQDMKERSSIIDKKTKDTAREAEQRFQTALRLAEEVKGRIDAKEYAQMKSGLLINLGLVKDICGPHEDAVAKIKQAIKICKESKLKEDLFRCQIILAGMFRQRMKDSDIKMASITSEEALQTAKSIGKKIHICDALIEVGLVRICQRNFRNAKRTFIQAYLEKSPSEEDHAKAIRLAKLSHLIYTSYEQFRKDETPSELRLKLCDKLGDLFVAINNYKLAVDFYKKALDEAIVCKKTKNEIARILYSLAETYADDAQFESALKCYKREYSLRNGKKDQCQSLIRIAHMHEYLDHESEVVCETYEKALERAEKDPKLLYSVLKYFVPYLKQRLIKQTRCKELEDMLLNVKSYPEVVDDIENEDIEESNDLEDEVANIDDIISDDDEDNNEVLMIGKRRSKGSNKFKPNEVGDTPLHEACIKGDIKRVKWLIDQGHDVNPRDNAGWIPLHEACNHGHYQIAEFLIENGADVNNRGLKGVSPLHDAATNGHFDIMRLLLKSGANAISLTDTGETVLSCLRDYKKRNYSDMSNNEISEYKFMEAELLNVMDKSGFNLMSEGIKNLGTRGANTGSSSALQEEVRPRPTNLMSGLERPLPNPVKDYRDVIGTLKRKRLKDDDQPGAEKPDPASQPAVYHSSVSTSASTKDWLIDDVSRQKQIVNRRSNLANLLESDEEEEDVLVGHQHKKKSVLQDDGDEDEDDEVQEVSTKTSEHQQANKRLRTSDKYKSRSRNILIDDDDDDDEEDDVLFLGEENLRSPRLDDDSRSPVNQREDIDVQAPQPQGGHHDSNQDLGGRISSASLSNWSPISATRSYVQSSISTRQVFDLFAQPLVVSIEARKLLIPIKDENLTIKQLKKFVVDRYSLIVNSEPKISLAPSSDPSCLLFDDDLARDVINETTLVATIDSWQLQSIEECYLGNCSKLNLEVPSFIKIEMRALDEAAAARLDLSFMRFPRAHLSPMMLALARREFNAARFTGSASLFECHKIADKLLTTITTWNKLTRLELNCTGLMRPQFESICNSENKLPVLVSLDLSVNSIVYKSKLEFAAQVERLRRDVCPSLKCLDMRRNDLQFVKSIMSQQQKHQQEELQSRQQQQRQHAGGGDAVQATTESSETTEGGYVIGMDDDKLDLSEALGLTQFGMEILGANQNEYSVYSASGC